jgi:hypothetical protein
MREIYANALQVVISLGERTTQDTQAFNLLKELSEYFDQYQEREEASLENGWAEVRNLHSFEFDHLAALLGRPWFNRTWVVQEVASAQTALFLSDDEPVPWEIVPSVLTRLRDPLFTVNSMESSQSRRSQESILAMESAKRSVNGTASLSLFEILSATAFNECTDPRDKVFAVLGLAKDWLEKGGLEPDYRTSTAEDIFKRFAMWDVKKNGKIRILSYGTGVHQSPTMPSWTPDWTKIENADPFSRYSERTMFSSSKNKLVDAWYSDHGRVLNIIGEIVDSVELIGLVPQFSRVTDMISSWSEKNEERLKEVQVWLQDCHNHATDTGERMTKRRFEEFWRTMTCSLTADAYPAPEEYEGYFSKYLEFIMSQLPNLVAGNKQLATQTPPRATVNFNSKALDVNTHSLIESSLEKWSSRRRFCVTSKGRLACVPNLAQKGDVICVLYGGEVPYVLRPHMALDNRVREFLRDFELIMLIFLCF